MKKIVLLSLLLSALVVTTTNAQDGGPAAQQAKATDPATMLQQIKDKIKPQMIEKTGLTDAQADKVITLNFEMRMAAGELKDLPEADRAQKIAELKAAKEEKMKELLTADQIQAVKTFYESMGKNTQRKSAN